VPTGKDESCGTAEAHLRSIHGGQQRSVSCEFEHDEVILEMKIFAVVELSGWHQISGPSKWSEFLSQPKCISARGSTTFRLKWAAEITD
jgi:hypothetical protein